VLVLTQAQLLKRYREKLENARRTSSPSASVLPNRSCRKPNQRTPSGVWTRNRGEKGSLGIGMEEVTRTGNRRSGRRRRRRGPARTHTPAAQPMAMAGRRRGGLEASPPRSLARSRVQLPRPTLWHPPNSCLSAFATRSICARS
jgi:hypothetical protein